MMSGIDFKIPMEPDAAAKVAKNGSPERKEVKKDLSIFWRKYFDSKRLARNLKITGCESNQCFQKSTRFEKSNI